MLIAQVAGAERADVFRGDLASTPRAPQVEGLRGTQQLVITTEGTGGSGLAQTVEHYTRALRGLGCSSVGYRWPVKLPEKLVEVVGRHRRLILVQSAG